MRKIFIIVSFLFSYAFAQNPTGVPTQVTGRWMSGKGYVSSDSGFFSRYRDTANKPLSGYWDIRWIDTVPYIWKNTRYSLLSSGTTGGGITGLTAGRRPYSASSTTITDDPSMTFNTATKSAFYGGVVRFDGGYTVWNDSTTNGTTNQAPFFIGNPANNNYNWLAYNWNPRLNQYTISDVAMKMEWNNNGWLFTDAISGTAGNTPTPRSAFTIGSGVRHNVTAHNGYYKVNDAAPGYWGNLTTGSFPEINYNGVLNTTLTYGVTDEYYGLRFVNGFTFNVAASGTAGNPITATTIANFYDAGRFKFGDGSVPSAIVEIKAGTATANTAPLKFNSGTLLTVAEAGAIEFLTDKYYGTITTGAARKEFTLNDAALTSGRVAFATTNGRLLDDAGFVYDATNDFVTSRFVANAGTTAANTAPWKYTSGTNLTTPENGAKEYDGTNEFLTAGGVRYTMAKTLTNTASLDFPSVIAGGTEVLTITVTGAADGDIATVGVPIASQTTGLIWQAYVSGVNTVSVSVTNTTVAPIEPATATFRVSIIKY